jgi:hypothetical protein
MLGAAMGSKNHCRTALSAPEEMSSGLLGTKRSDEMAPA